MDLATIENLFTQSRDADKEVWPDLDLLRTFVQLSSEGCVPKHFALRWHVEPPSGGSQSIRYFPFPAAPGVSYSAQMEGRVNEFCRLVWDNGRHLDACISSNASAEKGTMQTRQPVVYDCHAGLTDIAVPVCCDETYLGTIFTGQILRSPPSKRKFDVISKNLQKLEYLDMDRLYRAYMNTPVVPEPELHRTVDTLLLIGECVAGIWQKTDRLLQQERRLERMRGYQRKDLIERLVSGQRLEPTTVLDEELRDLGFEGFPTTVMVVRIMNLDTVAYGERQSRREIIFERAVSKLQDVIERVPNTVGTALNPGEIVILTRPSPSRNRFHKKLVTAEFGERLLDALWQASGLTGVVGIGREYDLINDLHKSYHEGLEACLRRDDDEARRVTNIDDMSRVRRRSRSNEVFWQLQQSLCICLRRSESREADKILQQMIDRLRVSGYITSAAQQPFMIDIMESLAATAIECGCDQRPMLAHKSQWLDDLLNVSSADELRQWICQIKEHLFREINAARLDRMSKLMEKAKAFIEHNHSRRHSLSEVAAHVGLSPSYFRHRFREITGMSFTEFQVKTRVRRACELLLDPEPTVTDIALRLGYESASKFARTFRKLVGASPRQYRSDPQRYRNALQ